MRGKVISYILGNQVLAAILILAAAWLIIQIRDVLITLFISYILMAAIEPYVEYLKKSGVPKPIAVIVPYLAAIGILLLIIITLLPFFITQIGLLITTLPVYLTSDISLWGNLFNGFHISNIAATELENIGRNVFEVTSRVFGGVISTISVFAISFYLLLYRETVATGFASLFADKDKDRVRKILDQVEDKLGSWLRGQIVLSAFIGVLTWIILTILGVEFALPLAVLAGILEIVPTIGPIISAIPAIVVTLSISPLLAAIVAISYFFIQLIENNILVPRIMQRAVGLNPIVIILGIIIGGKLLGISGALLAIPFISLLVVVYKNLE